MLRHRENNSRLDVQDQFATTVLGGGSLATWQVECFPANSEKSCVEADAARVEKALRLLANDPRYPSLRVKRMQGTEGIWEARASDALRITFEMRADQLTLCVRMADAHDATLKNP